MTYWEYMVLRFKDPLPDDMDKVLNLYGIQGWELVTVAGYGKVYIFKRPTDKKK